MGTEVNIKWEGDHPASFHSINVPSEWGHQKNGKGMVVNPVSIQLMSPASGDYTEGKIKIRIDESFHSINVPSEWGRDASYSSVEHELVLFPFN